MARSSLLALLLLAAAAAAPAAAAPGAAATTVAIETGRLAGFRQGDVLSFRGIPYAAPPTGPLRWRPTQPAKAWAGVREAKAYGAACPQDGLHREAWAQVGPQSEDCLFLNVWRPLAGEKLPVMVFIHGGGFTYGSAGVPLYDGAALARRGVVLVSMNYRLGRLGFFAHPALTREDPAGRLGNYAVMDQLAALHWVKRNIAAFGGDPDNVTLFGESAGAGSVQIFMSAPEARGLFQKAISESGSGIAPLFPIRGGAVSAEAIGQKWAQSQGLPTATTEQLRALPLDRVIKDGRGFPFVDGKVITEAPGAGVAAGHDMAIPMIVGSNTHEATLASNTETNARALLGSAWPELLAAYTASPAPAAGSPPVVELTEDALSVQASRWVGEMHARRAPTFAYSFGQVAADARATSQGAGHGGEMDYLFGTRPAGVRWDVQDREVSRLMGDYWVRFARTGDPNGAGAPAWERVGARPVAYLAIGPSARTVRSTPQEERVRDVTAAAAARRWASIPGPTPP